MKIILSYSMHVSIVSIDSACPFHIRSPDSVADFKGWLHSHHTDLQHNNFALHTHTHNHNAGYPLWLKILNFKPIVQSVLRHQLQSSFSQIDSTSSCRHRCRDVDSITTGLSCFYHYRIKYYAHQCTVPWLWQGNGHHKKWVCSFPALVCAYSISRTLYLASASTLLEE